MIDSILLIIKLIQTQEEELTQYQSKVILLQIDSLIKTKFLSLGTKEIPQTIIINLGYLLAIIMATKNHLLGPVVPIPQQIPEIMV